MFRRILIANRGEVAVRIARTADRLGVVPVFALSAADQDVPYARGREHVVIGPASADKSYLDPLRLIQAAIQTRCAAVHPGWGFLSEDPNFAALCEDHGITFVGPPAHVVAMLGHKTAAKRNMRSAGLPVLPGSEEPLASIEQAQKLAGELGFPLLIKAESGGGGRGMRVVRNAGELDESYASAQREAGSAFGDARVFIERYVEGGRHIEVQVLADRYGNALHFGERDCTVQRRHQKLVEEAPAEVLSEAERKQLLEKCVQAVRQIGYVGAGTLEFIRANDGQLYFMEMNARLQVEHGVSEMRTGVDLVELQLRVAAGEPLKLTQQEITPKGHVMECRINAEDPTQDFRPHPGTITQWKVREEGAPWLRVETHVCAGYKVPPFYDSLIAKVLVRGDNRSDACEKMLRALQGIQCEGVKTTIDLQQKIIASAQFRSNQQELGTVPGWESK